MKHNFQIPGLSDGEVIAARKKYGINSEEETDNSSWEVLREIVLEPMFLLLVIAAAIYFILDQPREGFFMVVAILIVSAISFFQDRRSKIALESLKKISALKAKILRAGKVIELPAQQIVVGDYVVVEEGVLIPADGVIIQSNDFTVNESILTGESFPASKDVKDSENNIVYHGTVAVSGLALIKVTAIGKETRFARIGKSILSIKEEQTPLQIQINHFVKSMAIAGGLVFLAVWGFNFSLSNNILDSLVKGLTLAMSILPEEIPVAFTTFMALGAWRLMQNGIVVKKIKTVETLGAATVICVDKTGTITENKMSVAEVFIPGEGFIKEILHTRNDKLKKLVETAMWASEPVPFDPMEKALHELYEKYFSENERLSGVMVQEYPLGGRPPLMTHIFEVNGGHVIAGKGSPERVLNQSDLSESEKMFYQDCWKQMASKGLRVLGVGEASWDGPYPERQEKFKFTFLGFVGFYDPPKQNISSVFQRFNRAGIKVKILTGDSRETTDYVASKINMNDRDIIAGSELMESSDNDVSENILKKNIFVRMYPEAKLKIINALKEKNQIVAMTGDGVNDGPALKAAHIGIAMGRQGSEIARQASALILIDGDLSKMVDAVGMGRKIYINLKRAIQYIISIHIPIVLMVSLPLFLGLQYPFIFTPVHVIFFEVIMGPTCSIVYENEPFDLNLMEQPPRKTSTSFFEWHELRISIVQGLVITAFLMGVYFYAVETSASEITTRTMVFATLIFSNIFLTLVNRSAESVLKSIANKNNLMIVIIIVSIVLSAVILFVPEMQKIFQVESLNLKQMVVCLIAALLSTGWIEIYKVLSRRKVNGLT